LPVPEVMEAARGRTPSFDPMPTAKPPLIDPSIKLRREIRWVMLISFLDQNGFVAADEFR
jgi:hypothetical protein